MIPRVAMIFAAGYGKRLAPLTDHIPKPLAPLLNRPVLFHTLEKLSRLGVRRFVINTHHLAEHVNAALDMDDGVPRKTRWGHIELIREEHILGTGGGLYNARDRLQGQGDILVVNGDIAFDLDLRPLLRQHRQQSKLATLAVIRRRDRAQLHKVAFDSSSSAVRSFEGDASKGAPEGQELGIFTGIHVISEGLFERLELRSGQSACIVHHGYRRLLEEELIGARRLPGRWDDLGTAEDLLRANHEALRRANLDHFGGRRGLEQPQEGVWIARGAQIDPSVRLSPPLLIDRGVVVEAGASIGPSAIIGARARVGAGSKLRSVVVLQDTRVSGAHARKILFNVDRAGSDALPLPERMG